MASKDNASSASSGNGEKVEDIQHYPTKTATKDESHLDKLDTYATANLNAVFENPLAGLSREALMEDVEEFCRKFDLMEHIEVFKKGALVSQNPSEIRGLSDLTPDDVQILEMEKVKKWHQPWRLYWLVVMCSLAAAVQGMDETANNGAIPIFTRVSSRSIPCFLDCTRY